MFASMVSWIASQVLLDLALLLSGLVSGRAELLRSENLIKDEKRMDGLPFGSVIFATRNMLNMFQPSRLEGIGSSPQLQAGSWIWKRSLTIGCSQTWMTRNMCLF